MLFAFLLAVCLGPLLSRAQCTASIGLGPTTVCGGQATPSLQATVGGGATGGVWTGWDLPGALDGIMTPDATTGAATFTPHFITQSNTNVTLRWTTTGCTPNVWAEVVITVRDRSRGNILTPQNSVCVGVPTRPLGGIFSGTATGGVWSGYTTFGAGVMTPSDTSGDATFTAVASQAASSFNLAWTTTGGCSPAWITQMNVVVVANTPATATIGASAPTVCPGVATPFLEATYGGSATGGVWSAFGTGVMTPSVSQKNSTFTPTLSQAGSTVNLVWTATGPCGSAQASLAVTVPPAVQSNAGTAFAVPTPGATLAANTPVAGATGAWTVVSGTGVFASPSQPSTTVSGLTLGDNVFRWTVTNQCGSATSTVTVTYSLTATTTTTTTAAATTTPAPLPSSWRLSLFNGNCAGALNTSFVVSALTCHPIPSAGSLRVTATSATTLNASAFADGACSVATYAASFTVGECQTPNGSPFGALFASASTLAVAAALWLVGVALL